MVHCDVNHVCRILSASRCSLSHIECPLEDLSPVTNAPRSECFPLFLPSGAYTSSELYIAHESSCYNTHGYIPPSRLFLHVFKYACYILTLLGIVLSKFDVLCHLALTIFEKSFACSNCDWLQFFADTYRGKVSDFANTAR